MLPMASFPWVIQGMGGEPGWVGGETVPLLPLPGQYGTAWGGGEAQGAGLWLQGKVISGVSLFLCFVSMFSLLPARAIIFLLLIIHSVVDIPAAFLVPVRPVCKNALCGFRSAHSVSEFLRLIVITGKNYRLIGQLEVPDLDPPPISPTPLIIPKIKVPQTMPIWVFRQAQRSGKLP